MYKEKGFKDSFIRSEKLKRAKSLASQRFDDDIYKLQTLIARRELIVKKPESIKRLKMLKDKLEQLRKHKRDKILFHFKDL